MERVLKHSKQRDAILALLKSVKSHPTADWLYNELKKTHPNISLATVYRNLKLLCDTGEIISLDVGDGSEHFDAFCPDHCHFVCKNCRSVIDIDVPLASLLKSEAEQHNSIAVQNLGLMFYGLCQNCK